MHAPLNYHWIENASKQCPSETFSVFQKVYTLSNVGEFKYLYLFSLMGRVSSVTSTRNILLNSEWNQLFPLTDGLNAKLGITSCSYRSVSNVQTVLVSWFTHQPAWGAVYVLPTEGHYNIWAESDLKYLLRKHCSVCKCAAGDRVKVHTVCPQGSRCAN